MTTPDTPRTAAGPRFNWRIEEDEDGYWSLLYTGDGITTPIVGFAATFPREEEARLILAAIEAEAAAPAAPGLDVERLARAIHEYGGVCASRYGRVTCSGPDHMLMAVALAAEYARLIEQPGEEGR